MRATTSSSGGSASAKALSEVMTAMTTAAPCPSRAARPMPVAYYASLGVRIDRVMTDNGSGYPTMLRTWGYPEQCWLQRTGCRQ